MSSGNVAITGPSSHNGRVSQNVVLGLSGTGPTT
jgi:hypothetical protein